MALRKKSTEPLARMMERHQRAAFARVARAARPDSPEWAEKWKDRSVGLMCNMALAQGLMSAERAKAAARAGSAAVLGVVVSVPRIDDGDKWERYHAAIEAGCKDVIDVPALEPMDKDDGTDP